jgi:iron-sulfur cluster insertion protein
MLSDNKIDGFDLEITESASKKLNDVFSKKTNDYLFRINISSGGCSGFMTTFSIDNTKQDDDIYLHYDNITIALNKDVALLIGTAKLHFSSNILTSYFALDVAVAQDKCSCGSSFSL